MFLVCSIILTALAALLCIVARNTKLDIRHRVLHIRYVIVTILFSVVSVFLFAVILGWLGQLLSLPAIRNLLFYLMPPSNVSAGFYWIVTLVCCVLLMLVYCLLMNLLSVIWLQPLSKKANYLSKPFILEKPLNALAGLFYAIRDDRAILPPQKANVGRWIRTMRRTLGVMLLLESLFIGLYIQFDWTFLGVDTFSLIVKSLYMIPVLSYIILEQVELFLSADRKKGEILTDTEEIGSEQKGSYDALVDLYNMLFGGKSLIAYYVGNGKGAVDREMFSGITKEQSERVCSPELLNALCRNVKCVSPLSNSYTNGLIDLINGENIAVFDTPWGEFDAYYLAYIQHRLSLREKVLVICDTELQVKRMKERFTSIFKRLNMTSSIWRIHDIDSMTDDETDVLICTEEQFLANPIDEKYPNFNRALKIVVVLNAYGLLCCEPSYISRLFDFFANKNAQFVFYIPENNTDIRNELQEKIPCGPIRLCENPYVNARTNMLFWRSEAVYKPQLAISERLYHDFGVAFTIAIIAGKCDVSSVHVLAPESVPTKTYYDLVTREYTKVLIEDYLRSDAINLSTIIHNNDYSIADPSALSFNVVYDEYNNLLNVAKTWLSYGGSTSSMLHIVSKPYMLRDYFACNMDSLCAESTGLQMIIPGNPLSQRTPAIALLIRMRRGIRCQDLFSFANAYGIQEERLDRILCQILNMVFGRNHGYDVYNCFSFTECRQPKLTTAFLYTVNVTLVDEKLYKRVCRMTEDFICLKGSYTEILPVNKADVYNRFLPKQCVSFGNTRYIIESIRDGAVQLKAEETVDMECSYTPIYHITGMERTRELNGHTISTDKISTQYFEARISREITAYYAHPGLLDLTDKTSTTRVDLQPSIRETKTVPCLRLALRCPLNDCSDKVANTLCFLLRGALETFLPKNYQDLLVFSKIDREAVCKGVSFKNTSGLLEDPIPSDLMTGFNEVEQIDPAIRDLIPEIHSDAVEANTAEMIYLYIAQFSEQEVGLLSAIAADFDRILLTVMNYLNWSEARKEKMPEYLRFGYTSTPGIFDTSATVFCLSRFVTYIPRRSTNSAGDLRIAGSTNQCCSFCGKPVSVSYVQLDDGRIMCPHCHSHITNSREEIKQMLKTAIDTIQKHYGVTIPEGIKVKFKSASTIRKECGTSGPGRVLGFYNLRRREIWVERNGPKPCVLSTLIHELTHAWQHANVNMNDIPLQYLEGHTSYVEVECTRLLKQPIYAEFMDTQLMAAQDEYGIGYRFWKDHLRNQSDKNIFHHMLERFK